MYEFLLAINIFVFVGAVLLYVRKGVASIYHPVTYYLFFHGFIFVIRPMFNWWYDFRLVYNLYQFMPSAYDREMALIAPNVGLIAFLISALRVGSVKFVPRPAAGRQPDFQRYARQALWIAAAICGPLALYSLFSVLKSHNGGNSGMVFDASSGIAYNTTSNGYLTDANAMLAPLVVLLAWQYRFRSLALIPFLLYAAVRLMIGNGRWTFVMASASLALLFLYDRRKKWFEWRAIIGGAIVLSAFTVVGANRGYFRDLFNGTTASESNATGLRAKPLEGMDYANQEYLEYLIYVVPQRTRTYGYFLDNLQLLTEPVPRVLWKSKPIGAPIQLYKLWDYGQPVGMTYSIVGEGWQQFGLIGVAIWCALFGYFFGAFYRWFVFSNQTMFQVSVYAMTLPLSIQFFRDGTLLTFVKFPVFIVLPIFLWWIFTKMGFRKSFRRHGAQLPQKGR